MFPDFMKGREKTMRGPLYTLQNLAVGEVSVMARPRGGDWLVDEMQKLRACGVDMLISLLTPMEVSELELEEEASCCRAQGIVFRSLAIIDRSVPPFSEQTFQFLRELSEALAAGQHIVFHCRHGLGRAVLMAASLLVLAGFVPFELLGEARGYVVPETAEQKAWVVAFFQSQQSC